MCVGWSLGVILGAKNGVHASLKLFEKAAFSLEWKSVRWNPTCGSHRNDARTATPHEGVPVLSLKTGNCGQVRFKGVNLGVEA